MLTTRGDGQNGHPLFYIIVLNAIRICCKKTEHRIERLIEKQGLTLAAAVDTIDMVDEGREKYIKQFSDTSRYDTRNYDIVLSIDRLSVDDAVQVILDYVNFA